ncbi:uncharacterized protein LOC112567898 isoform X2 [Pomacea canaliculata]|uniref:uncharacterized protein LOC112567898 isoform X2 n=1 Tax=Pomacea canaliculata TaxID=400727 RepID=UPI000D733DCA|nr:uncharacterized protein LOC112567898 isoform X2 [Pomacea canaliculata]
MCSVVEAAAPTAAATAAGGGGVGRGSRCSSSGEQLQATKAKAASGGVGGGGGVYAPVVVVVVVVLVTEQIPGVVVSMKALPGAGGGRGTYVLLCRLACGVLSIAWSLGQGDDGYYNTNINSNSGMSAQPFQGIDSIIEVECSGRGLDSNTDLLIMTLFATNRDQIVASANLKKLECTTSQSFSMCIMDSKGHDTKVKTLVLDLAENEKRVYGCNVSVEVDRRGSIKSWSLEVGRQKGPTTPVIIPVPDTIAEVVPAQTPTTSSMDEENTDFEVPPGALITGVVFLIFFMILCIVLIVLHFRDRRRRHYLSDEYDTPLPITGVMEDSPTAGTSGGSRRVGEKERILGVSARSPRPSTSSPLPSHLVSRGGGPSTSGGSASSLRYQQTGLLGHGVHDDTGYVTGSSVYYAEPWSGVDNELKERLRPSARVVHEKVVHEKVTHERSPYERTPHEKVTHDKIPHDSKGGPLSSSAPPADDNA